MGYKRKSQKRAKLTRQIRQQRIYLRMRDQGNELKTSTLVNDLGGGWRRPNYLATSNRDDRPVPTVSDDRKDANLTERPTVQPTHVLTLLIPKEERKTKRQDKQGYRTKQMRQKSRHIDVRLNLAGTPNEHITVAITP
jgi:hypothetical protein